MLAPHRHPPREAHAIERHILDPRAIGPRGRDDMAQRQIGIEVDRAVDARMSLARDDDERLGAQIVAAQPLVGGQRDVEREVEIAVREYRHELAEIGEHTSELQSLMRISYAVFCLKK